MTADAPGQGSPPPSLRCPVCGARLRAEQHCGRCGVDLSDAMRLQVAAWRARRDGWRLLAAGELRAALTCAERAAAMVRSASARRLIWLCQAVLDDAGRPSR